MGLEHGRYISLDKPSFRIVSKSGAQSLFSETATVRLAASGGADIFGFSGPDVQVDVGLWLHVELHSSNLRSFRRNEGAFKHTP